MELKLNNNELVAVLTAVQRDLEDNNDKMSLASLLSFVKKVNDNVRIINRNPEELAIEIKGQIEEIQELMEEE